MIHGQNTGDAYFNDIFAADEAIKHADELLNQTEDIRGIGYQDMGGRSEGGSLFRMISCYEQLSTFLEELPRDIREIDEAFRDEVANGAAEDLSHVDLREIQVPNTTGVGYYDAGTMSYIELESLSLYDFMGDSLSPGVPGFAEIFQTEWDMGDTTLTYRELERIYEDTSEYSNEIHSPGKQALSEVLNICSFGVKQLFDCISGYDILRGKVSLR